MNTCIIKLKLVYLAKVKVSGLTQVDSSKFFVFNKKALKSKGQEQLLPKT